MLKFIKACALDQENDRNLSFTGRVFPRPFTHGGGQVQGDKALMGGLMRGTQTLWGANFDRLYHKLKVLLLLS